MLIRYLVSEGCTNPDSDNYDALATDDNGSCYREGCTNSDSDNYDSLATVDNGSCFREGCMNSDSDNYDALATVDDGSCYREGCTNSDSDNYDALATVDDGSCYREGCTLDWADNYDSLATTNPNELPEQWFGNTGVNMTIMLLPEFINLLPTSDVNAYVVALSSTGNVIGSASVSGLNQTYLTVWGDDSSTPEVDGAITGEEISIQLVNGSRALQHHSNN